MIPHFKGLAERNNPGSTVFQNDFFTFLEFLKVFDFSHVVCVQKMMFLISCCNNQGALLVWGM